MARRQAVAKVKRRGRNRPVDADGLPETLAKAPKKSKPRKMIELNPKEYLAITNYIENGNNMTQAMLDAGYAFYYSTTQQHVFFDRPCIRQAVTAMMEAQKDKWKLSDDWVNRRLMALADANPLKILEKLEANGGDISCLTEMEKYAVSEIVTEVTKTIVAGDEEEPLVTEVETKRKLKAEPRKGVLDSLARIRGMFQDKLVVEEGRTLAERLQQGRKRMNAANAAKKKEGK